MEGRDILDSVAWVRVNQSPVPAAEKFVNNSHYRWRLEAGTRGRRLEAVGWRLEAGP